MGIDDYALTRLLLGESTFSNWRDARTHEIFSIVGRWYSIWWVIGLAISVCYWNTTTERWDFLRLVYGQLTAREEHRQKSCQPCRYFPLPGQLRFQPVRLKLLISSYDMSYTRTLGAILLQTYAPSSSSRSSSPAVLVIMPCSS